MNNWVPFFTETNTDKLDEEIIETFAELVDFKDSEYFIKDDKIRQKVRELSDKYLNLTFNIRLKEDKKPNIEL
jgi:hypothetical protein